MKNGVSVKDRRHVIYLTLMMLAILIFVMGIVINFKMAHGNVGRIIRDVITLVINLGVINYWYFKSEKFFADPYDDKYDLTDHIKKNGNKIKGSVVHIRENIYVENHKEKIDSTLVIEFNKDGQKQHILLEHFPYYIRVLDTFKESLTEDNYLELSQYNKDGVISFNKMDEEAVESYFEGSIKRNFEGVLNCDIYEYRGRYLIGDIPGYEMKSINLNSKNDFKGYIIFTIKVFVAYCILAKIYAEMFL